MQVPCYKIKKRSERHYIYIQSVLLEQQISAMAEVALSRWCRIGQQGAPQPVRRRGEAPGTGTGTSAAHTVFMREL